MRDRLILHPLLLALFPALALFAHNQSELQPVVMGVPILMCLVASLVLWGIFWVVLRNPSKAALLVSLALVFFFTYGHVFNPLLAPLGRHRYKLLVWLVLLSFAFLAVLRSRRDLAPVTTLLNNVSLIMVLLPSAQIVAYSFTGRSSTREILAELSVDRQTIPMQETLGYLPDIYYFIPDRYAGQPTLEKLLDFDNAPFLDSLRSRGFFVADSGRANYATTPMSLASSLNMEYLDRAGQAVGEECTDSSVTFGLIENNRVQRLLRGRGYQYIHFGSWWQPTRRNPFADDNVVYDFPMTEFSRELLLTTASWPLLYRILELNHLHRQQVLFKLGRFPEVIARPGPKFVFMHLLLPHTPYVFDEDGAVVSQQALESRGEPENYRRQLRYVNGQLLYLVDEILANSTHPPVIIIQADEGPHFVGTFDQRMSPETIKMKSYILNVIHLPSGRVDLPVGITPVNTFRIVFNECFGMDFPMLEDRSYWFEDPRKPYRFIDVTDIRY